MNQQSNHNFFSTYSYISGSLLLAIDTLEQAIDRDIDIEGEIDILNGLFFHRVGYVPKQGERVEFPEFDAVIEKATASKIIKVRIFPKKIAD